MAVVSFEQQLDPVAWAEILVGGNYVCFDIVSAKKVELYFTAEPDEVPEGARGTFVYSHPASWDYEGVSFNRGMQRLYARGDTLIRGVRA